MDDFTFEVHEGKFKILFKDNTDPDYLIDCLKDHEEPSCLIQITIWEQKSIIASYERIFNEYPTQQHYHNFITKFLSYPQYRTQFTKSGNWTGVISYTQHGNQIKPVARVNIQRLNSMSGKIRFKDFMKLKTGGFDSFSRLNENELLQFIPQTIINELRTQASQHSWSEQEYLSCLRWIARGLKPILAVRKIEVDREVKENQTQRKKS